MGTAPLPKLSERTIRVEKSILSLNWERVQIRSLFLDPERLSLAKAGSQTIARSLSSPKHPSPTPHSLPQQACVCAALALHLPHLSPAFMKLRVANIRSLFRCSLHWIMPDQDQALRVLAIARGLDAA